MPLRETLEKQGKWLFRWRSYLPLLFLPILLIALRDTELLKQVAGDLVDDLWEVFCVAISFVGFFIRCLTVGYVPGGTSGRNTREQRADELNTTGIYSIVRHPLYFGNFIIFLGIILFVETWWFELVAILAFWLYYTLIMFTEEEFLRKKYGDSYIKWAENTPVFFPRFTKWREPALPFSFKNVLRREYSTFFAIIACFTFLDIGEDFFACGRFKLDWGWITLFSIGLIVYIILRTLKKLKILDVEGR